MAALRLRQRSLAAVLTPDSPAVLRLMLPPNACRGGVSRLGALGMLGILGKGLVVLAALELACLETFKKEEVLLLLGKCGGA